MVEEVEQRLIPRLWRQWCLVIREFAVVVVSEHSVPVDGVSRMNSQVLREAVRAVARHKVSAVYPRFQSWVEGQARDGSNE